MSFSLTAEGISLSPCAIAAATATREGGVARHSPHIILKDGHPVALTAMVLHQHHGNSEMFLARDSIEKPTKRNSNQGNKTVSYLKSEDVAFFFTSMTWNAGLLEVLLARAPNPLHSAKRQELSSGDGEYIEENEMSRHAAAYPTLEEALLVGMTSGGKSRPLGTSHTRRSRRRKVCRSRATRLQLSFTVDHTKVCGEAGGSSCDNADTSNEMRESGAAGTAFEEELYDTYLTEGEEEELDGDHAPRRCLDTSISVAVPALDSTLRVLDGEEKGDGFPLRATMRDFLRLFYQCFLIAVAAQVRQKKDHQLPPQGVDGLNSDSLSAVERRALSFVQYHLANFKKILSQYVMCGEREVERRGAQPLLVGAFRCPTAQQEEGDEWVPPHAQLYICGKEPVYQPLLLDVLCITRVVQCYPDQTSNAGADAAAAKKNMGLSALFSWRQLLLEEPISSASDAMAEWSPFLCTEEWILARELLTRCLSPLVWAPQRPFGPYMVYTARLPLSDQCIAKLVLPAEDCASYDLSAHFQEGVFRFIHGMSLALFDTSTRVEPPDLPCRSSLVHCSAGMHRSSGVATAYLLWLTAFSCGRLPVKKSPSVPSSQERQPGASYLSAVLRHRQQCHEVGGGAAEKGGTRDNAAEADSSTSETCTVLQRCIEHVRQQRTMAVPIPAVQKQLQFYAHHLHLE